MTPRWQQIQYEIMCPRCGFLNAEFLYERDAAEFASIFCYLCGFKAAASKETEDIIGVEREPHPQMVKLSKILQKLLDLPQQQELLDYAYDLYLVEAVYYGENKFAVGTETKTDLVKLIL